MIPTKEQERKALEQIKKILKGLGDDPNNSYVCRAFDGCVEDAESNIEYDFASSYKSRCEHFETECERLEDEIATLKEQNKKLAAEMELAKRTMQDEKERANRLAEKLKEETARADSAQLDIKDNAAGFESVIKAQELEIIKLKAKLYDMMVGA